MAGGKKYKLTNKYNGYISFALTSILAVIIFSIGKRMIGGTYSIIHGDMQATYVPAMKCFWNNIFKGEGIVYSFKYSMGVFTIPLYAHYACFCPFNILAFFIPNIEIAIMIILTLKLSLASWSMHLYLKKVHDKNDIFSIIFSVSYGLCGYFIAFYSNIIFLDGAYMLPVILMLVNRLIKSKKFILLILSYAYIFIVNFFMGYIIGIFSFLYFVLTIFLENGKDIKSILKTSLLYALSGITSVLLSAVVLYPTAKEIFENMASDATAFEGLSVNIIEILSNIFVGGYQNVFSLYPVIYCGLFTIIMVPAFFICKKTDMKDKILYGVLLVYLLVCCVFDPLYIFMHAFDNPDYFCYRFAYFIPFVLIVIAAISTNNIKTNKNWYYIISAIMMLLIYFAGWKFQNDKFSADERSICLNNLIINFLFLSVIFILVFAINMNKYTKKIIPVVLLLVVSVELVVNGAIDLNKLNFTDAEKIDIVQFKDDEIKKALSEIEKEDDSIYRVHVNNTVNDNNSQLYGYMGVGYFASIENPLLREFLYSIGYTSSTRMCYEIGDYYAAMMLFSQKYIIDCTNPNFEELIKKDNIWRKNDYCLNMGYMVSEDIYNLNFADNNAFDNQNILLSKMTGDNVEYWKYPNALVDEETDNTYIKKENNKYYIQIKDESNRNGKFNFYNHYDGDELYAYTVMDFSSYYSMSPYLVSENGDQGDWKMLSYAFVPHIMKLGKTENDLYNLSFQFYDSTNSFAVFNDIAYAYPDNNELKKAYDKLSNNMLDITYFREGHIKGNIVATKDMPVLFMSIPYDKDWVLYVDGVKTKIEPTYNGSFISAKLTEGSHEIELKYVSKDLIVGACISLIGIIMLVILVLFDRKIKKNSDINNDL